MIVAVSACSSRPEPAASEDSNAAAGAGIGGAPSSGTAGAGGRVGSSAGGQTARGAGNSGAHPSGGNAGNASGGAGAAGAASLGGAGHSGVSSSGGSTDTTGGASLGGGGAGGASAGGAPSNGSDGADAGGAGATSMTGGGLSGTAGAGGAAGGALGGSGGTAGAPSGADPKFLLFLLLGQSNMEGAPQPGNQDRGEDPRIKVLAYDNCPNVQRTYNEWYPASPPLHSCGAGLGPGDYFAKTLIESLPEGYTIGLVPCAVNGAPIDLFRKGMKRTGWQLPPDNHWETGYEWIVSRARLAQQSGVIRGILFHQGESDNGQDVWVDKVRGLVSDLRTDLGIGEVPFLAGELYYDGCCNGHNALVRELPNTIPNAFVVSASGLNGTDQYHFDLPGQRELGKRYAQTLLEALTLP
ncbi:MAG TPA: sialate O-acetylesterase [Polyangiaceae bacterium]|nr:sialate O-acetylesterase [Polyangiaceae bacterium]